MSAGLTGLQSLHDGFDLPLPMIRHTKAPHQLLGAPRPARPTRSSRSRLADELEQLIVAEGPETVAAFIGEPLQGAGGVIVAAGGLLGARSRRCCARHDVLLICRRGDLRLRPARHAGSAPRSSGSSPTSMTIAKGITSAYVPLSGCLVVGARSGASSSRAARSSAPFGHGYTYTAHPLAAAAALANLDVLENDGLVEQAAARGAHLHRRLHEAFDDHPLVGEVRGLGLIAAVEFVADKDPPTPFDPALKVGARVYRRCLELGADLPRAADVGHDRVLAAVRRHGGRARRDGGDRAARGRRRRVRAAVSRRLGLIVNPVAGLGGPGRPQGDRRRARSCGRALELGARAGRARRAPSGRSRGSSGTATGSRSSPAPGAMGGDAARRPRLRDRGRRRPAPATRRPPTTPAPPPRRWSAARSSLILYAGGDGTTRDIVDAVGTRVPILGIPTGVKMHSGVFATSPEAAGDLAASHLAAHGRRLREAEVMDVDEDALRDGRVSAHALRRRDASRATACASRVPRPPRARATRRSTRSAASSPREAATGLTLFGPGTTTQRILAGLGIEGTLLGVDAVEDGRPRRPRPERGRSSSSCSTAARARIVVSVVGGQGYVLGRGQPAAEPGGDPAGRARTTWSSSPRSTSCSRSTRRACSSTPATSALDRELSGYRRVRVAPGHSVVVPVAAHEREAGTATLAPAECRLCRSSRRSRENDRTSVHGELRAGAEAGDARGDRRREHRGAVRADPRVAPLCAASSTCRRRSTSEAELSRHLRETLARNESCEENLSFLGAGCWQHHVPAVCDEIVRRTEFLTPVWGSPPSDHGRNQAWFEFCSQLGELLELDFVGLPVYSWGCAAGHADPHGVAAHRPHEVLVAALARPRAARRDPQLLRAARDARATSTSMLGRRSIPPPGGSTSPTCEAKLSERTAAVYFENPSYLGIDRGRRARRSPARARAPARRRSSASTRSRSACSRRPATTAPTSSSARPSRSACT